MSHFRLSIVTPEKTFYEREVSSAILPGAQGYLGVLAQHAPLITPPVPGKITVRLEDDSELIIAVSGGFLEVADNVCTVLADTAEMADAIDIERARKAMDRARERLHKLGEGWDMGRATLALERAKNRVRVFESRLIEAK